MWDRRTGQRSVTLKTGKIAISNRASPLDCAIFDISARGALILVLHPGAITEYFKMTVEQTGTTRHRLCPLELAGFGLNSGLASCLVIIAPLPTVNNRWHVDVVASTRAHFSRKSTLFARRRDHFGNSKLLAHCVPTRSRPRVRTWLTLNGFRRDNCASTTLIRSRPIYRMRGGGCIWQW
jgi:hypothetical protein